MSETSRGVLFARMFLAPSQAVGTAVTLAREVEALERKLAAVRECAESWAKAEWRTYVSEVGKDLLAILDDDESEREP